MSDAKLVVVQKLNNPVEAELIKGALADEGIACFVEGENQGSFTGILEIRLFVAEQDVARAEQFLAEYHARQRQHLSEEDGDDDESLEAVGDENEMS